VRHRQQPARTKPRPDQPAAALSATIISAADMDAAVASGQAAALSQVATFIRHYRDTWWLSTEVGWLPVPPAAGVVLDQHAERLQQPAVKSVAERAAIGAVIELARKASNTE
jgi:hypothetical protein